MPDALRASIARAVREIPKDKAGRIGGGISLNGAELEVGWKPTSHFELGGYASRLWRGGWTAGAQGQFIW